MENITTRALRYRGKSYVPGGRLSPKPGSEFPASFAFWLIVIVTGFTPSPLTTMLPERFSLSVFSDAVTEILASPEPEGRSIVHHSGTDILQLVFELMVNVFVSPSASKSSKVVLTVRPKSSVPFTCVTVTVLEGAFPPLTVSVATLSEPVEFLPAVTLTVCDWPPEEGEIVNQSAEHLIVQ